jgi:hypothetical protein
MKALILGLLLAMMLARGQSARSSLHASPAPSKCPPEAYPMPPGDERDGDGDGCAGE